MSKGARHRYVIALGSNQRHPRHGSPAAVVRAAFKRLDRRRLRLLAASPIMSSAPLGPSRRRYANAAALIATRLEPSSLLARLKRIECKFGRRTSGMRWRARVLDLDIVLWNGGPYSDSDLTIPHVHFRERTFVLQPTVHVAPEWRDPLTGLSIRHLTARLTRPRPSPRATRSGKRLGGP